MSNKSDELRKTMRLWASGVVIVTTKFKDSLAGMTVSSFSSVTVDPPVVMVCLNKTTHTVKLIKKSHVFTISILGEDQLETSRIFSGQTSKNDGSDRFNDVEISYAPSGNPIIKGSIAWLDCRVRYIRDFGTHYVLGGMVVETKQRKDGEKPLLYYDRDYRKMMI